MVFRWPTKQSEPKTTGFMSETETLSYQQLTKDNIIWLLPAHLHSPVTITFTNQYSICSDLLLPRHWKYVSTLHIT